MNEPSGLAREVILLGLGALFGAAGGAAGSTLAVMRDLTEIKMQLWGKNKDNGIVSEVKALRQLFNDIVLQEALQERRNKRQHPSDPDREEDYR